jgi:hypothetical protein
MENDKTPTAAEFLDQGNFNNTTDMMIEFAKLHVKAALEAADKEVPLHCSEGVLNCYPNSNIK